MHVTPGTRAARRASSLAVRWSACTAMGLCVVVALAIAALLASGASAQTAYECTPTSTEAEVQFKDAHCREAGKSASGFKHVVIAPKTPTPITLSNSTTFGGRSILKLKSTYLEGEVEPTFELQATEVEGIGSLENQSAGSETWPEGNATVVLRGVTVTLPSGKGCIAKGETGTVGVVPMKTIHFTQGSSNQFRFSPASGESTATFTVEGCSNAALNHVYNLTGSILGNTNGATTDFTHAGTTEQGTMFLSGRKAGFEGSFTFASEATGNGIALTNALPPGQTAYECAPTSTKGEVRYEDAQCKVPKFSGEGFKHVAIAPSVSKEVSFTNSTSGAERSTAKLKSVQSGVTLELQSTEVEGTGTFENLESSGEAKVEGNGGLVYRHVTVAAPAGKGCKVKGSTGEEEVVPTSTLHGTTKGLTKQIKFTPASGEMFAQFTISGCSVLALNHVYTATGSVIGNTSGTTISFTHANTTSQATLLLFGQKAGLEGELVVKSAATGNGVTLT